MDFDWDENYINHIARHNVTPEEVESAFYDSHRICVSPRKVSQERRWAMLGSTQYGRILKTGSSLPLRGLPVGSEHSDA